MPKSSRYVKTKVNPREAADMSVPMAEENPFLAMEKLTSPIFCFILFKRLFPPFGSTKVVSIIVEGVCFWGAPRGVTECGGELILFFFLETLGEAVSSLLSDVVSDPS